MLNDKLILLNEMVISSGNENNTHFSVTYETESIPEHDLSHRIATFDMLGEQVNQTYLHVKRFIWSPGPSNFQQFCRENGDMSGAGQEHCSGALFPDLSYFQR